MKDKILNSLLNLIKIKSIVTFLIVGSFVVTLFLGIENATLVMLVTLVIKNLFDKDNMNGSDKNV